MRRLLIHRPRPRPRPTTASSPFHHGHHINWRHPLIPQTRIHIRTLIPAPAPNSGPIMERRSDRALPSIRSSYRWLKTLPLFILILTGSALGIFNYQKSSSSVVTSTMFALRRNRQARELLGDEIYFKHRIPWIWGQMNQLHGRIDISYSVKGSRDEGVVRFRCFRRGRMGNVG